MKTKHYPSVEKFYRNTYKRLMGRRLRLHVYFFIKLL